MRQSVMTARASKSASAPNSLSSMPNARLIIPLQDVPSTKRRRLRQHQFARFMRPQRSCRSSFSASGYAQMRGRARGELFWSERRARLRLPNSSWADERHAITTLTTRWGPDLLRWIPCRRQPVVRHTVTGLATAVAFLFVATPLAVAEQRAEKMYRVGYLATRADPAQEAFRRRLRELGWVENQNIGREYRTAEGRFDRLPGLAAELVRLKVDVIVAGLPRRQRPSGYCKLRHRHCG